jgi:hypothetical protein
MQMTAKSESDTEPGLHPQHQWTKRLNNQRTIYIRKKTASEVQTRFRQYPKQELSEIVERLLRSCLESPKVTTLESPEKLTPKIKPR